MSELDDAVNWVIHPDYGIYAHGIFSLADMLCLRCYTEGELFAWANDIEVTCLLQSAIDDLSDGIANLIYSVFEQGGDFPGSG